MIHSQGQTIGLRPPQGVGFSRFTHTAKEGLKRLPLYLLLFTVMAIMLLPFFWTITTSFKTPGEAQAFPPVWIPSHFRWQNYVEAWNAAPFGRYFINSVFIALTTAIGGVLTSILAAYAFAKMEFFGKNVLFYLLIGTMMIPGQMLLVPNYLTIIRLGWYDTYQALIVPWVANVFGIFLLRQFFRSIPDELWDSAQIDGCSRFRFLWQFVVPLSRPALVTLFLFRFIGSWNAFLWVLIMTSRETMRTLPVGLYYFVGEAGTDYHLLTAAATFAMMPIILLFLVAQRQFIQGVARTGLK